MVDCDESDKMVKINGKVDKSDTYKNSFHSLFKKFLQTNNGVNKGIKTGEGEGLKTRGRQGKK